MPEANEQPGTCFECRFFQPEGTNGLYGKCTVATILTLQGAEIPVLKTKFGIKECSEYDKDNKAKFQPTTSV